VDLGMDNTKHVLKMIDLHVENILTILDSKINMMGRPIQPLNEHKVLHFDSE